MSKTYYFEVDENGEFHKAEPPTVSKNLVVVVRCKDCKHGEKTMNAYRRSETFCFRNEKYHDDNWYCADGEKKC